ncbi:MAG: copper amine oxidase N-terminal domain-containing protein [Heliobacteriaceae bacterium]|nr:copper amine oxidase N-terminal domain-containing protein [Heliobacteriaceae bacterium]
MKNKLLAGIGVVMLFFALLTVAFADKPIDLLVNGQFIKTDVPPQSVDGRVLVPVRSLAEALGAEVKWNDNTKTVLISAPKLYSLQEQVKLLQAELAPKTPREAAEKWAKGVKERNGALQYAVLSPELKEQSFADYESYGWVTGMSSPWVECYEITKETKTGEDTWEYEIKFESATSTGPAGSSVDKVVVKQYNQNWYVAQVFDENRITSQLEQQVKDFLGKKYGQHYDLVETDVSPVLQKITDGQVEAEFMTKVTLVPVYKTPGDWPVQQGKIKFREENRDKLSPDQIEKVEANIAFWHKELQEYTGKPGEANECLQITTGLFWHGKIKADTVKFCYADPDGKFLPVKEEDWSSFKTAEELVNQGYEEMRQLVGQ